MTQQPKGTFRDIKFLNELSKANKNTSYSSGSL